MASENVKAIAEEVLGNLGSGKKVSVLKIAVKRGMKKKYANSGQIQKTKTYQKTIEDNKQPIIERLIIERDRAITAMKGKISKAKYRDCVDAVDKYTKNIQLLSGGATEKIINIQLSETIAKKNDINQRTG